MYENRNDIPAEYKWNLSEIYPSLEAFQADFKDVEKQAKKFPKYEATMLRSAKDLYAMFEEYFAMNRKVMLLYEYSSRNFDVDTSVNSFQALDGKVSDLYNKVSAASYFVSPKLMKLDAETLEKWYRDYPELKKYKRAIDMELWYKPHTLSDVEEKLIADVVPALGAASDIRGIFSNSDIRFGKIHDEEGKVVELRDANYIPYVSSQNRNVRRAAFTTLYKTYEQYANTYATMINGFVKEKATLAKVRKYPDSLTASVYQDEVTPDIYNNLIKTVGNNLDSLYEYYDLKKELLGVPQFHMYDVYPTIVADFDRKYPYSEAVELTLKMAEIYGPEYHDTLKKGLTEDGWVDVYPNRGKRTGAYSSGSYDTKPYILLNYKETFDDVFTLAHESGHSMHSYFSKTYNQPHESNYTLFVAEVASTVNELLLADMLLKQSKSNTEKMYVLNQLMDTYKGTLFRQTMFAEFEKEIHELVESGEVLTAELLNKRYYKLVRKYFGPRCICDKQIAYEWMRIPHFYYNFYVYKYATCISAASSIVKKMKEQGQPYVRKYIEFLKCGGSRSPIDSLKVADIDLSDPKVIEDAMDSFRSTVRQFREIYSQTK